IAWGSAYSTPQWITIDLEDTCTIGRIVLNWESTYGTVYEIRVSNNNSSWTTIYSTSSGDGGIDDVDVSGVGRYVQMYGITSSLPYGFCIREFEIYGYPVLAKRSERTVDNTPIVPSLYTLYQNYPNPFNPKTTIEYDIPESEHVTLTVFNMHGEHVVTIQNGYQPGGHYRVMWDGRDENGRLTASGIYVYKLAAGNFVAAKKMLFVR
ncbi:discoidin domain-containing protein, partial [candidate division KSB1 bacterium]|nr:discoidin domain-containing protein [candidate division KSB1 bacterium]